MIDVELHGGGDLARISKELRRVGGKDLQRRFTKGLRAAAKPAVPALRAAARSIPAKRPYRPGGLRAALARAVTLTVRTTGRQAGVTLRVDGRKMPDGMKSLPSLMEGLRPWRHPVYGESNSISGAVRQDPHPFFYRTVRPLVLRSRRAIGAVLDGITKDIT